MSEWRFDDEEFGSGQTRDPAPDWQAFADAVSRKDAGAALAILAIRPELGDDYTLFGMAVGRGLVGIVDAFLLRNPHFLGARDEFGHTALMNAAAEGHIELVRRLVQAGADVSEVAYDHDVGCSNWHSAVTALAIARSNGRDEVVGFLAPLTEPWLRKRSGLDELELDVDRSLFVAETQGRPDRLRAALGRGADPRAWFDRGRHTTLHHAAEDGEEEVARLLIDAGADVNIRTAKGQTPLTLAIRTGHHAIARMLRDAGAVDPPPIAAR